MKRSEGQQIWPSIQANLLFEIAHDALVQVVAEVFDDAVVRL